MPDLLEKFAYALPLTYAIDALNVVVMKTELTAEAWRDLIVVIGCIVVAILLGAMTLRRKS
jgi:ABC-2 type transport system permease protein